jgi:NADPH2:quinone reductase
VAEKDFRIVFSELGGPDVLKVEEMQVPPPGPQEVQIRQRALGVNFIDTYHRSGLYKVKALPSGLGVEAAGEISALGSGLPPDLGLEQGMRVAYSAPPPGAYATRRNVEAWRAVPLPDGVTFSQGAASMVKGLTAQMLLRQVHPVDEKTTLLLHAAAGGVGSIATQWARHLGATVIGTVSNDEKADFARKNGASHIVRYDREDVVERVMDLTSGAGVDVAYDAVGQATFEQSIRCVKKRGLVVSYGQASGKIPPFDLTRFGPLGSLFFTRPVVFHYTDNRADLMSAAQEYFDLVAQGVITVPISEEHPLEDAALAHAQLESRKTMGAVVLMA